MFKFGTGGWRAIIGDEYTKANLQKLAFALAHHMKREGTDQQGLVLGYDRRFLSKESCVWLTEVLAAQGIPVKFVDGASPTPLIMFWVKKQEYPYGLMVTASHNPAVYNGVKVMTAGGRDAEAEFTSHLEEIGWELEGQEIPTMPYEEALASGLVEIVNPRNDYIDAIIDLIDTKAIHDANLKIALDPMYGVSQQAIRVILLSSRAQLEVINENHDALFGGRMPAPSQAFTRNLATYVIDHEFDLGIATDGDADRLGVIDDKGNYIHSNQVLCLLYYYLLAYKGWRGPVVRNVATTHTLDKIAESFGEKCYEVPVGFKHISSKMSETDALIGGESSGGLTVRGHIHGKDGVYASSLLVEMRAVTGMPISALMEEIYDKYGRTYMAEHSFPFDPNRAEELRQRIYQDCELPDLGVEVDHTSNRDGLKVYLKDGGWLIARFSGTEPLLRVFAERENEADAEALAMDFARYYELISD
ncbi:phosphonomutase [Boudabousia liubingyangii]|uniref:Phosphonomutase n=1 Tax=Boudabousia liubingyangii TaxID=1921764 RepID=A0A1Q5PQB1_9ACTO|nr:phosphoglucomutase/phosphomannomutase family protein [Boudabousia liubingyangii]OKL49595.1 phosphonomutase [Boudabousia liubingyangii]